jgi:bifunctional UDP-N-acetylglucosamine pyrophosphorylase / glucosamine-1-phosphate N-acetyltransferase
MENKLRRLIEKGVTIPNPGTILIGEEVDLNRISGNGTVIYAGCKIFGEKTLILDNAKLGYEAPVTVEDCQIGPEVHLKGGYFSQSVFLHQASLGSGAHIRKGTILEEQASVAHAVGLKQTILFPFVTLGSLINFCDCFMAGGTSRKNHSEVGSSFIHFNYTPNQDKATPSMMGDVPYGVMLNQNPIFLGGQGGIVGPIRLAFGTITAAGTIYRKDELRNDRLLLAGFQKDINIPFSKGRFPNIKRIVLNNLLYLANLIALKYWYNNIRTEFVSESFPIVLLEGLQEKLDMNITERLDRLKKFSCKVKQSDPEDPRSRELLEKWSEIESLIRNCEPTSESQKKLSEFKKIVWKGIQKRGQDYIRVIQGLSPDDAATGSKWLQHIMDETLLKVFDRLPSFGFSKKMEQGIDG